MTIRIALLALTDLPTLLNLQNTRISGSILAHSIDICPTF